MENLTSILREILGNEDIRELTSDTCSITLKDLTMRVTFIEAEQFLLVETERKYSVPDKSRLLEDIAAANTLNSKGVYILGGEDILKFRSSLYLSDLSLLRQTIESLIHIHLNPSTFSI